MLVYPIQELKHPEDKIELYIVSLEEFKQEFENQN
jgi:hypothetical protein